MKTKLDRKVLERLRTQGEGRERIFDVKTTGFFARRTPSGQISFGVRVGPKKARRDIIIGPLGPFTLETARAEAERHLAESKLGRDPAGKRAKQKATPTFKAWAETYLQEAVGRLSPRWVSETRRYLKAVPFGSKLVSEVSVEDVQRFCEVQREKGVTTANRALAAVRASLSAAWRRSLVAENVARKVRGGHENPPRDRVLSDDELVRLLKVLDEWPDPFMRAAFRLTIETGARRSEVLRAEWEHVNLEEGVWRLPVTKSGKPQVIPLMPDTVALLRTLPRAGRFVIPGRAPDSPRKGLHGPWTAIKAAAGLEKVTPHDLRRTYGLAVARTAGILAASKLLRHSDVRVTSKVYAPFDLAALREAADTTAKARRKRLLKVVNGGSGQENPEA